MARVVPPAAVLFLLAPLLAGSPGCATFISKEIVRAPNAGKTLADLGEDADDDALDQQYVARQLRVDVGPPKASLAAWIVEAYSVDVDARLRVGDADDPEFAENLLAGLDPSARVLRTSTLSFGGGDLEFLVYGNASGRYLQLGMATRAIAPPRKRSRSRAPQKPKGTVLVLHGIGDRKENIPYRLWARVLAQAGYRAVLVDLRGHGRSTGEFLTYGVTEARDLAQFLDALEEQSLVVGPVGAWGISYGGAVALQWAAADPRVKAVVAFEPFCTLRDAVKDFAPLILGNWRFLAAPVVLRAVTDAAARQARFDPDDANPLTAIARTTAPVLLVHGSDDRHLPPRHSRRLHAAAPDRTTLCLVEGANHLTLWIHDLPKVRKEVTDWLDEHLAKPPATLPIASSESRTRG
jgi:pimeloyl-ACP methyl ester carboxylesterase